MKPLQQKLYLNHNIGRETAVSSLTIRPIQAGDLDAILAMHRRLSADTIYQRYLSNRMPERAEIAAICNLGRDRGHAFVAVFDGPKPRIVGLAYYIKSVAHPDTAEPAILVEDAYQGQRIGSLLWQALTRQAQVEGICFYDSLLLAANRSMMRLLKRSGATLRNELSAGTREVRVKLC